MSSVFGKSRRIISVSLIALWIAVQTISIAHAFEHDPGTVQDTACATCISLNQLEALAVDHGQIMAPCGFASEISNDRTTFVAIVNSCVPRVRGPPESP